MKDQRPVKMKEFQSNTLNEEVFDEIYQDSFEHLFLFARSLTKSEEIAKDVISEVFLNLWKNRERFREIREIESYLFIAVKNHSLRALTDNYHRKVTIGFGNAVKMIDNVDPEELLLEKELLAEIELVVSGLPDQCQLIYRMAKDRQLKYREIAEELGISIASVKTQLVKAAALIRETIRKKYDDNAGGSVISMANNISVLIAFSWLFL